MSTRVRFAVPFSIALCAVLLAACSAGPPPDPTPVTLDWREITLPPAPAGERDAVGDGAYCDGNWYLVGAYAHDDQTRPAAWRSHDGQTWVPAPLHAESYYGLRSLVHAAACRDGALVALGGKVGGAHGNPRMSSYHDVDGVLTEVQASFELYGGPAATNVGRLTAGEAGFLIVGNRSSGAAVWRSPDGARFDIVEGAPVLAPGNWAADAAFHDGAWVVVGGTQPPGGARDAASWRSPDGRRWTAIPAQSSPDYDELTVVAEVDDTLVSIGPHGDDFQSWRLGSDSWTMAGRFGERTMPTSGPLSAAIPVDLAAAGDTLLALVKAANRYQLWRSLDAGDSWQPVAVPDVLPAAGGQTASLVSVPDGIMLVTDDLSRARVWVADLSG